MTWYADLAARLASIFRPYGNGFNWATSGPAPDESPPVRAIEWVQANLGTAGQAVFTPHDAWDNGWWAGARRCPANPGRLGALIIPRALVVHTTDTYPGAFDTIVRSWTSTRGQGNAAHFLVGRTPTDGVVQFAPITRNANHAGGSPHGNWKLADGGLVHPNTWAVGVELDCAGQLKPGGQHPDSGKLVPYGDVIGGPGNPWTWHSVTPYQLATLRKLWDDLRPCLLPIPAGTAVTPDGDYRANQVPWAGSHDPALVGHVSLDPVNRSDPGPQVMAEVNTWT